MINGTGTPALNGPLGNFVGNTNQSGNPPAQADGTVGQLPAADFAKTPLINPTMAPAYQDAITVPDKPMEILAQQMVATVSAGDWSEDELYDLCSGAWPYRALTREEFDEGDGKG